MVELQNRAGDLRRDGAKEDFMQDLGLVRSGDDHDDLPGCHDGTDAHRDRGSRDLVDGGEEPLVGLAGHFRQFHFMRHDREMIARLVEADVPVMADAEQLDIHAAPILDLPLIGQAHRGDIRGQAVGARWCFPA